MSAQGAAAALTGGPFRERRGGSSAVESREGRTSLHFAAEGGDAAQVAELVESGADLNAVDRMGRTPLHVAAEHGQFDALLELLRRDALSDLRDVNGDEPLHLAVAGEHKDIIEVLLRATTPWPMGDAHSRCSIRAIARIERERQEREAERVRQSAESLFH